MNIQSSSNEKCYSSLIVYDEESSVEPIDEVFRQLKPKFLSTDLFQAVEDDFMFFYGIKSLLKKLNTPSAPKVVVDFIGEFKPLLDQITADMYRKNEAMGKLKPK